MGLLDDALNGNVAEHIKYMDVTDKKRFGVFDKKIVLERDLGRIGWIDDGIVSYVVPYKVIRRVYPDKAEEKYVVKYYEENLDKEKDFTDYAEAKRYFRGLSVLEGNMSEYMGLLLETICTETYYMDGPAFINGRYFFIKNNEEIHEDVLDCDQVRLGLELLQQHSEITNLKDNKYHTIMKWMITAPFAAAMKLDKGRISEYIPYLAITGQANVGKTRLVESVIQDIYGEKDKTQSTLTAEFRLGFTFEESKFPFYIDEAYIDIRDKRIINTLKAATMSTEAMRRGNKDQTMTEYAALRSACFMSNDGFDLDENLSRRFIIVETDDKDIPNPEDERKYKELIGTNDFSGLIMQAILYLQMKICTYLSQNPKESFEDIVDSVFATYLSDDWIHTIRINDVSKVMQKTDEDIKEAAYDLIWQEVNRKLNSSDVKRIVTSESVYGTEYAEQGEVNVTDLKLGILENDLVPGVHFKKASEYVVTSAFLKLLRKDLNMPSLSLDRLARVFKSENKTWRCKNGTKRGVLINII